MTGQYSKSLPVKFSRHLYYCVEINLYVGFLGGGPPKTTSEDPLHEQILTLITPSAVGLQNPFDSDSVVIEESFVDGTQFNIVPLSSTQNETG